MIMFEFSANKKDRLDRFLRQTNIPGKEWLSRQAWDELILRGKVRVNGRVEKKPGCEIAVGAQVQVEAPEMGLSADPICAKLLWRDPLDRFGIFFKNSGLATYPLMPWEKGTFAHQVVRTLEEEKILSCSEFQALSDPPILEAGLVQRLDTYTSGMICIAFTKECKGLFRKAFSEHKIEKKYWTIVSGHPPKAFQETLYYSNYGKNMKAHLAPQKDAVEAFLEGKILVSNSGFHLVEVSTKYGIRHVVRAGLSALGFPILGDLAYGGSAEAPHHMLHARSLKSFDHRISIPDILAELPSSFLDSQRHLGLHYSG